MKNSVTPLVGGHLSLLIFVFSLVFISLLPQNVSANDYLEKEKHYDIYASGVDKVHFKIPVWAYGKSYDYYAYEDSYISYTIEGGSETVIAYYKTDKYDENENKESNKGTAFVYPKAGQGTLVITSIYSGVDKRITNVESWSERLYVKQTDDDDCPQVTLLEIDWYPPESLNKKNFKAKIVSKFRRSYTDGNAMTTVKEKEGFTGYSNIMTPQLYTPYIYQINEGGPSGYGYAAIPYMLFNDPVSYHTSLSKQEETITSRGGTLYVMTTDTVQEQFNATFTLWRNQANQDSVSVVSTSVDIPPFHRIYDFRVAEEQDSTGTYTGNNILNWEIKNPALKDLVDGDFFEIQRALESDFSDAQTLDVIQMVRNEKKPTYTYVDNSRETWTGNVEWSMESVETHFSTRIPNYVIYDEDNQPFVELDVKLKSDSLRLPAVPVYYRIRRASTSIWGWDIDFAKKATLLRHNFLAPLAQEQEPYTLDDNFEKNRKVNFRFKIENKEASNYEIAEDECTFTYSLNKVMREGNIGLTITFEQGRYCNNPEGQTSFRVIDIDGKVVHDWKVLRSGVYIYPANSTLQVRSDDVSTYNRGNIATFQLYADSKIRCATEWQMASQSFFAYFTTDGDGAKNLDPELEAYLPAIKDSLYSQLKRENTISLGRCMWDRTAQLVLTRTIEETGQTMRFVVPQDSVRRQPDGSWIATFSDVADQGCSTYRYSVSIDQSKSDLHVQDSMMLRPIELTGPSLYFDDAAKVTVFSASQGDASTTMKKGVQLRWEVNSNAVDEFILTRLEQGSSENADTIYRGINYSYFDRTAIPDVHYDYTISAHYTCNGKTTDNAMTTEGWRTKYGEISGLVLMADNTGMPGVEVALQDKDGKTIRTMTTNSMGAYMFDSLEYDAAICDKPILSLKYTSNFSIADPQKWTQIRVSDQDGNILADWASAKETYTYPAGFVVEVRSNFIDDPSMSKIHSFTIRQHCTLSLAYDRKWERSAYHYTFTPTIKDPVDVECFKPYKTDYVVIPTSQYGVFSFNSTSAGTASITLTEDNAVASGINFVNTSSTRLSGRVLYKNSTIPVSGAMFVLNGDTICRDNVPLTSAINGNFELVLPLNQVCRLQVVKEGHTFEGNGILHVEEGEETFALTKPLDGVRFYDMTTVRLIGRVAGGNDQRDLPRGLGLGTNNLGDKVQLVLQLEGDNTAQIVHDPDDLTLDSIVQPQAHIVYKSDMTDSVVVGATINIFEKKRIVIKPDPLTGEYQIDLFPVKYKVVQASATGYATLFAQGQGNETFDLTNAPLSQLNDTIDDVIIKYNAVYDRIYHTPMLVNLKQMIYGLERDGLGEPTIEVSHINPSLVGQVELYTKQSDGAIDYLLGYPVFIGGRKYQFMAEAYEDYYYNNDSQAGNLDRVPLRGGSVTIHNGMHNAANDERYALNEQGRNSAIWLMVDDIDAKNIGEDALRTVSVALEQEGNMVETNNIKGFITGTVIQEKDLRMTDAKVVLLDIIRDPGGAGSSSWVESGSTYNYSYRDSYKWETGLNLEFKYGLNVSNDIGAIFAPQGAGSYIGSNYTTSKQFTLPVPITHAWSWGHQYDYTITTTQKITTSTSSNKKGVGSGADIYFGTTISQIAGKAKTISVIGDSLYNMRQPAIEAGTMKVIARGTDANGNNYYLVTGQKIVLGSTLNNTFAYTQHYVLNTILPELALERQNLLVRFESREEAKAVANATGEEVYWLYPDGKSPDNLTDTLSHAYYEMVTPDDIGNLVFTDRVAALNKMLLEWSTIIYQNEMEKVLAVGSYSKKMGTYSVSYGANINHSDAFTASANYNEMPQGEDLIFRDAQKTGVQVGQSIAHNLATNLKSFFGSNSNNYFGKSVAEAMENYFEVVEDEDGNEHKGMLSPQQLGTVSNSSKFSMTFEPVLNNNTDNRLTDVKTIKKSAGFTIVSDTDGDITVSAYRVPYSAWADSSAIIRDQIANIPSDEDRLYGSYVFVTDAGATFCPHEDEERTMFYNKGTLIGNGTQWIVKPELSANTYEISNVQPQNKATFLVQLMNNSEVDAGVSLDGHSLTLMLNGESNPNGAKVTIDGMPLTQGISYWVVPGKPITKTLEVERGTVDDYDNLSFLLYVSDCAKTLTTMNLSVHFLPVSTDVNIAMPRQNWVMNTLSARDSIGYYLPVDIDGFDIHHKNFDHIEFQYKLSTQSENDWVNQCSFYASDSLYRLATGNKAMIENGRITPFRFYGERDPMEQRYDLRAVSFCRYGSGFVTKSSAVMSGIKDTRPPRVFGEPEPVNAILGVGDNLKLRFNEPIAGNYLDEDNNFQIKGVTNATGITTEASVHFDGTMDSYAISQVNRSLSNRSFTLDVLVKTSKSGVEHTFFEHGIDGVGVKFGLTADNRLVLSLGTLHIYSLPLDAMLEFTRVCVTFDKNTRDIRFFAGTNEVTDSSARRVPASMTYNLSAPLVFGRGFEGNMLELRLWSKNLTPEEITATHMRHLTGYEKELVAYYPMTEGQGTSLTDHAGGATLSLHGASWNLPKGISLAIAEGERVTLNANLLGRSAVYDETLMLWFRATGDTGDIFSAGHANDTTGTLLSLVDGTLVLQSGKNVTSLGKIEINEWQHFVLAVNRTYNTVSAFVNGQMVATFAATELAGITGAMYLGGNGFAGNIDEFAIFEQALPKTLIEEYGNHSPAGDEMGLLAYLPFEEQKQNANGILELVFSPNDQRQYRDPNTGKVIDKVVPLLLDYQPSMADKTIYAPVLGGTQLSKLNFDWAFNQDELLINLNMPDREINKQMVFVTVRDVEDLNGNPMPSPVMWMAYVDRNSLTWEEKQLDFWQSYNDPWAYDYSFRDVRIINNSGKRHQFTIESLPEWLTVSQPSGTIQPIESYSLRFTFDASLPPGVYTDVVYVTDENGLSEPLKVIYTVQANCPWTEPDKNKFQLNMSLCGQVLINGTYNTNTDDKVIATYRNECIGMANVAFDNVTFQSTIYMTIYGNDNMNNKNVTFQLWQSSTGKVITLTPSEPVRFAHGSVYGCGDKEPIILTAGGSETQNIALNRGWNWTSFNIDVRADATGVINNVMIASDPWMEGDMIKNPVTRNFCVYSDSLGRFTGSLVHFHYIWTHMIYSTYTNTMRVSGNLLPADSMHITLNGGGQWNAFPCLFNQATPIAEALSDYLDDAEPGDIIKSHDAFAVFSQNRRWEGNLTAIRPGEGYFFRRMAPGNVIVNFYNRNRSDAPKRMAEANTPSTLFNNPNAATNMTMIAKIAHQPSTYQPSTYQSSTYQPSTYQPYMADTPTLFAYVGSELVAVASPQTVDGETLYFLTLQTDYAGEIRFQTADGTPLVSEMPIIYNADSHQGTIDSPIILNTDDSDHVYKIIENGHVIIIRRGERYDVTGKKLTK